MLSGFDEDVLCLVALMQQASKDESEDDEDQESYKDNTGSKEEQTAVIGRAFL